MPKYVAILSKKAQRQLDKLNDNIADPIIKTITLLEDNPRPLGYIKLKNRDGFRIRVGDYRVIYDIIDEKLLVNVITLGHRKDIYN